MKKNPFLVFLFASFFAFAGIANAQLGADKETYETALTNMKARNWAGARDAISAFIEQNPVEKAVQNYGPRFGWFWYHKGLCEMQLKDYKEAAKSFETCYTKFQNDPAKPKSKNLFDKYSLLKWGEAEQELGNFKEAVDLYGKFLKEKDDTNPQDKKFSRVRGKFYTNVAVCNFKLNKLTEGIEALQTAIDNQYRFPTPPGAVYIGVSEFLESAISLNKEKTILDFLKKHREQITYDPVTMNRYSRVIIGKASKAVSSKMKNAAVELLSLVPDSNAVLEELKVQQESVKLWTSKKPLLDGRERIFPERIAQSIANVEKEMKMDDSNESLILSLNGFIWSNFKNNKAAYAIYKKLEDEHQKSKNREANLFNLIRVSSAAGKTQETEEYAKLLLRQFPESEYAQNSRSMMLTGLLQAKQYKQAIRVAKGMLGELEESKPNDAHDIALYVLGSGNYYLNEYEEAEPYLRQHIKEYEGSRFAEDASYFLGSNLVRLQEYSAATAQLAKFTKAYPESSLLPFAYYDKALSHYSLNELGKAQEAITVIEDKFLNSRIVGSAFNLKGNILQNEGQMERAEKYYVRGLKSAERAGNNGVAAESVNYLVALLTEPEFEGKRDKDLLKYYDLFWEKYSEGSPYKSQIAVITLPALKTAGRGKEGLEKMREVIATIAKADNKSGLEELINSYRDEYLETNGMQSLKEQFYAFPNISLNEKEAQALLRISLIGAYEQVEEEAVKAGNQAELIKIRAAVKALFIDLKSDFNPKILSPLSLIKVADFIRNKTATPKEATAYYQELLDRDNQEFKFPAMTGLADLYVKSGQTDKGVQLLEKIYTQATTDKMKAEALFGQIEAHIAKGAWAKVNAKSKEYLDTLNEKTKRPRYRQNRADVNYSYALSFEKLGKTDDAIAAYLKTYSGSYMGTIRVSAPAVERLMKLWWKRNKPAQNEAAASDRQGAYNAGWNYIEFTKNIKSKMTPEEKANWEKVEALVKQYEADPAVTDMATFKAQQENN